MSIGKNIAFKLRQYKLDHELSTVKLAERLHLSVTITQEYLNGGGNPRADTIEMIACQMGITVAELVSEPSSDLKHAQDMICAAKEFAALPPGSREKGIQLFLEMVDFWSEMSEREKGVLLNV